MKKPPEKADSGADLPPEPRRLRVHYSEEGPPQPVLLPKVEKESWEIKPTRRSPKESMEEAVALPARPVPRTLERVAEEERAKHQEVPETPPLPTPEEGAAPEEALETSQLPTPEGRAEHQEVPETPPLPPPEEGAAPEEVPETPPSPTPEEGAAPEGTVWSGAADSKTGPSPALRGKVAKPDEGCYNQEDLQLPPSSPSTPPPATPSPPAWWLFLAHPAEKRRKAPSPAEGWWGLSPLAVGLLLYLPPALASGWALDDWSLIVGHPHATDGSWVGEWVQPSYAAAGSHESHVWRPLVATFWRALGWAVGIRPAAFHLLALLLHLTNLLILQRVIRLWALRLGYSAGPAAAILALGWTLHPATPDVAGWVSSTFELGATLGVLMALRAALRSEAVFPWMFAALLCKETALPAVIGVPLLAGLVTEKRQRIWLESLAAGLLWMGLHRGVTGQGGLFPWEGWVAWLQLLGVGWGPLRASMTHLFDPQESVHPGLLLLTVGILCLGVRGLRPLGLGGLTGAWMVLPAGFGVALIGIAPMRYMYLPLAIALVPLGALPIRKWLWAAAGVILGLGWGPRAASRADEWRNEEALWQGEMRMEAGNPVATRQWVRYMWDHGDPAKRPELLQTWRGAIDRLPRTVQWFNPVDERLQLAQGAFIVGDFPLAQHQVELYLLSRPDAAPKAWCLLADCLERTGASAQEVELADGRCREGKSP